MGNSQSSFEAPPRHSHRLSKPKTGNHATAGLLSPNGFSNSSRRLSNARLSLMNPPPPSPASTPTTSTLSTNDSATEPQRIGRSASAVSVQQKESRRRSLFRSLSSQGSDDSSGRRRRSTGPASRVAEKLGRANSMTYESAVSYYGQPAPDAWQAPPRSRTSWNYDMSSYEAKRLLNLTEEPAFEHVTAMSENRMTVVTETTWKSSNPANPAQWAHPPSTTISRANSDLSLYMPVRRRSIIQKPGVATRSNSTRESPSISRPNFRFSHPPTPSLSRQQSVESYRSGIVSMPPRIHDPDAPRVVTPCEDEYMSIGAFKLGSLRITNGTASPGSPEVEKNRTRVTSDQSRPSRRLDYFEKPNAPLDESLEQPPKLQLEIVAPQPRAAHMSPVSASFFGVDAVRSVPEPALNVSGLAALDVTPSYLADINFGAFSLHDPPLLSPALQTTSKTTALDDDLFEDDVPAQFSSNEVLDVRLDPSAKPQPWQADAGTDKPFVRADSGFISTRTPSEHSHKLLTKADSGYSSNVSLRSFQVKAQERELTLSLEKQLSHSSRRTSSTRSDDQNFASLHTLSHPMPPQREAPPPPVPPKDFPPVSPTQSRTSTAAKSSHSSSSRSKESSKPSRPAPTPIISRQHGDTGPKSPESMPLTPRSARSDRSASALSIGSGSQKPSRLSRLLSGARRPAAGPLTVYTTHVEEKSGIPAIPRDVEYKLQEHTGLFPTTTKRLALKPRSSMDTLKTIFSVGSSEVNFDAVKAIPSVPSVPEAGAERKQQTSESSWRHTLQAVPSSIAHVAAQVIPRKPIARKPVPVRQESVKGKEREPEKSATPEPVPLSEAELTSFASVSSSLGNNAYDAAFVAMATGKEGSFSPKFVGRTMSLTETAIRHLEMRSPTLTSSPVDLLSPALPSPLLAKSQIPDKKARSSPPISMMNRRPMSLRVPPPLRSQSSTDNLSRKGSRESIQSYPSGQPLVRKTSRDSVKSYPSFHHVTGSSSGQSEQSELSPPIPPMDPRRIMSFRHSQPAPSKAPTWDVQTDHDPTQQPSRASSQSGSRRNSISSVHGQEGPGLPRPSSAQSWQVRTARPQLRHRASYDGYNVPQKRNQYRHPPTMSNGYSVPSKASYDPWNSNSQLDPGAGQYLQDGRYPPYVPRGHHRNHSISRSTHGPNPPYRVLHSYNSPAYKNAPIWG